MALLIDKDEIKALFNALGDFLIYPVGSVVKKGAEELSHQDFLSGYEKYIQALKEGIIPDDTIFRSLFSSIFTVTEDHLYALQVQTDKQIIRNLKPFIQLQVHNLDYSLADGKFRSMTFGQTSILWGIQFSYPQLFEDSKTRMVHKVDNSFPNTLLFRSLQKWARLYTQPTPFIVNEKVINIPMRLGRNCFTWINRHPQLSTKDLKVKTH